MKLPKGWGHFKSNGKPLGKDTECGFEWGAVRLTRLASDKPGWVAISVETPRKDLQIYVTKTGLVRVFEAGVGEWKLKKPPQTKQ